MVTSRRRTLIVPLVALCAPLLGCGESPLTAPSTTNVVALQISGPSSIATDSTSHYSAIATYADGSTRDVTSYAAWQYFGSLTNPSQRPGVVTGAASGESLIRALFDSQNTPFYGSGD